MQALNKAAKDAMLAYEVHAVTDVTGFSLMGHAAEMAEGSQMTVELDARSVPLLPQALDWASMGLLPEGMYRNRDFAAPRAELGDTPLALCDALFDPQTSGGLLIAVAARDADALLADLQKNAPYARRIGRVVDRRDKAILLR